MDISIIICTYNRETIIKDSIESFYKMTFPLNLNFELIVIDNNSSDNTKNIIHNLSKKNKSLVYYFELAQGLSHARNRGIKEATGNILVFVDDDVYFSANWLIDIVSVFDNPDIDCVGGNIVPVFVAGKPSWLQDPSLPIFGSTNYGKVKRPLKFPEHPFGGNMAFRSFIFEKLKPFNTSLGRKKNSLLSNEEAELFYRITQSGIDVWFTPKATIYHRIPNERAKKSWIFKRYYWQGISEVAFQEITHPHKKLVLLKQCLQTLKQIQLNSVGNIYRSPKKVYWDLMSIPFERKIKLYSDFGRLKQSFFEIFKNH